MVLFTLTGLNVDVGLYEFIEYPTYDFPDISASYYLDLSFNPIYFDNIFYFKTTNPDLLDFTNFGTTISKNNVDNEPNYVPISNNGPLEIYPNYDFEFRWKYKVPSGELSGDYIRFIDAGVYNVGSKTNFAIKRSVSSMKFFIRLNIVGRQGGNQIVSRFSAGTSIIGNADDIVRDQDNYLIMKYSKINNTIIIANANHSNWLASGINDDARWNSILQTHVVETYDANISSLTSITFNDGVTEGAFGGGGGGLPDNVTMYLDFINIPFLGFDGDMNFKCESSYWPDISFSEGVISNDSRSDINNYLPPPSAGGFHYNKNIGVQWLAKNITGGYNNSDLFANEEALVQQYVDLDMSSPPVIIRMKTSYQYFRIIITNVDAEQRVGMTNVGIASLVIYNSANSVEAMLDLSASTHAQEQSYWKPEQVLNIYSGNTYGASWSSTDDGYELLSGNYIRDPPEITTTTSGDIAGEWIQWKHNSQISISKMLIQAGGHALYGLPPSRFILAGRNDPTETWNSIDSLNYIFDQDNPNYQYTIGFKDSIKHLITNTLDVSGGTDAAPLSNADVGRNNVSREALLHLLDNDVSSNVQRVHNMIAKSQTDIDSDGNDISFGDTSNLWIPIEFFDGDTIKFKLIYKPDQITNGSGAAVDDSGNALGTNPIEDQDYVVRLNILGNRSELFIRSSFLSSSVVENNVTINGNNHTLLDNIIQPNSSVNRNSNTISVNDTTVYNDPIFGSYVKVGRAHVGPTNSGDTLYNYYTWNKDKFNNITASYNWTYGSLYNNSVYLTWIFRLHSGGYNKSIARQDIVPVSYSTADSVDLTNDSINIFSEGNMTNVLNNPQQFAVFYSKQFGDANRNCTFGFFNGKYHFCNGALDGAASIPLSSSMTNASEQQWRVLTLAIGPHSNNSGSNSEVSIFENGILLGNTNRYFSTLGGSHGDNSRAFGISGQGNDFVMGSFQGQGGTITNHLPSMRNNESGIGVQGDDDDRHFKNTLPYDLALWELHESSATGVNVSFKAKQIYSDYVNIYKYDFINGVSTA